MPSRTAWFVTGVIAASMLSVSRPASAQAALPTCAANPCTAPLSGTMAVNSVGVVELNAALTTLDAPRAADYVAGSHNTPGPTATVRANTGVRIVLSSTSATWTRNAAASTKPVGDLRWATTAGGTYVALTTGLSTTNLLSTAATAGASQQVFYQTLWKWTQDGPGTYTLPIVFTMVSP
jgi:hypothetical protein